jgi:hypothetical protein
MISGCSASPARRGAASLHPAVRQGECLALWKHTAGASARRHAPSRRPASRGSVLLSTATSRSTPCGPPLRKRGVSAALFGTPMRGARTQQRVPALQLLQLLLLGGAPSPHRASWRLCSARVVRGSAPGAAAAAAAHRDCSAELAAAFPRRHQDGLCGPSFPLTRLTRQQRPLT